MTFVAIVAALCALWVMRYLSIAWRIDAIRNEYHAMKRPAQNRSQTEFDSSSWTGTAA